MMNSRSIRVAIVGVGNCASSFVQGVRFYREADDAETVPGLMHVSLGGYHVRDIEFCAAFDVSAAKVGLDLAEAIGAEPNNTCRFADVPTTDVRVGRGPTLDGIGEYLRDVVPESQAPVVDVARELRESRAQVVVCYLPVGSERATAWYARQALEAGCGFVNCIPVFLASQPAWAKRFARRRLPIIGDDVKSQVGATIVHRVLTNLFRERGVRLDRTYQLNFGGNTDFLNMLERSRVRSKKVSKTRAVTSQMDHEPEAGTVHVGPSDHVPWLLDRKFCHIRMEGTTFGNVPLSCEVKLEVWDSPNSAGVVIDAVRCIRLALDHGLGGALLEPSSWLMKSPPQQFPDWRARALTEAWIERHGRSASGGPQSLVAERLRGRNGVEGEDASNGHVRRKPEGSAKRNGSAARSGVNGQANGDAAAADRSPRRKRRAAPATPADVVATNGKAGRRRAPSGSSRTAGRDGSGAP